MDVNSWSNYRKCPHSTNLERYPRENCWHDWIFLRHAHRDSICFAHESWVKRNRSPCTFALVELLLPRRAEILQEENKCRKLVALPSFEQATKELACSAVARDERLQVPVHCAAAGPAVRRKLATRLF